MAKFNLKIQAHELRKSGISVNEIAAKLGVAKSTASYWVRDIILSVEQLEKLRGNSLRGAELGRTKGAFVQKQKRIAKIKKYDKQGILKLKHLSPEAFFTAGIALYWAEGSKKTRKLQICNSDPELINFMIKWFCYFLEAQMTDFVARIGINEIHQNRDNKVKKYWSKQTNIPLSQFSKTSFKKAKNKKIYENFNQHYGTLDIKILKPGERYYKILGLINGLSMARRGLVFQDVS